MTPETRRRDSVISSTIGVYGRCAGRIQPRSAPMFHRILLAVDLADEAQAPKGLAEALELVKLTEGELRLVNVQPLLPATFMEYVPADFDAEQERRAHEALREVAAKI